MEMTSTEYEHEQDEIQSYRSVSFVCVAALIGGLLSVVALAHPILWLVPTIAFALGLFGLRRVTRKSDQFIGKTVAVIGICVSVLFFSVSVSKYYSGRWLLSRNARQFGQEWMESLVVGEREKAHQGWLDYFYRQPQGTNLSEFYAQNAAEMEDLEGFLELETVNEICQFSSEAEVNFVQTDAIYRRPEGHSVFLIFAVDDKTKEPLQVVLHIKRIPKDGNVYWSVNEIHKPKA